ncbi:MAG: hypothetical protein LQ341_006155 [Variospora aurantia]|nr:MAG: hypothetical protein LQ341_006155 [Variospora aurantia]
MAGFLGASIIAVTSVLLLPFCSVGPTSMTGKLFSHNQPGFEGGRGWGLLEKLAWVVAATIWGGIGSLLDSALGGWFQASVVDARTGKVVEGSGGTKVLLAGSHDKKDGNTSRRIESGIGFLDNNAVNILMAFVMSIGEERRIHYVTIPSTSNTLPQVSRSCGTYQPTMAALLKQSTASSICNAIDKITAERNRIPGCVFAVVNKDGRTLFEHTSGKRGADMEEPMTLDSIFWIASCTKMICGVAAMQLCEQGKLSLDDPDKVNEGGPELKTIRILRQVDEHGKPELVDKTNRITLKMLLTHTVQVDVDWAGTVIERISGMSLHDYFQKNIFQPLGIKNINMFPPAETKHMLAHMHHKDPYGIIREQNHPLRRLLIIEGEDLLERAASLDEPSIAIPQFLDFGRKGMHAAKPDLTNQIPEPYPQPPEQSQGWGIS